MNYNNKFKEKKNSFLKKENIFIFLIILFCVLLDRYTKNEVINNFSENVFFINNLSKKRNTLQASIFFLVLFILLTIIIFNIYKGTKIALPNLQEEIRESSHFYLLKSMGWSLGLTLLIISGLLYKKPVFKYAVNKAVTI